MGRAPRGPKGKKSFKRVKSAGSCVARRERKIILAQVAKVLRKTRVQIFRILCKLSRRKRPRLSQSLRREVWRRYNGEEEEGKCYCCGGAIRRVPGGWHCSHVHAKGRGGEDTAENLRPCCPPCNIEMGIENMYEFMARKKREKEAAEEAPAVKKEKKA